MTGTRAVVVGYDGSDFSMQALDWAMDECELRRLPLTVAHAWRWPYGEAPEEAKLHLRKAAEHVLYHGADCARSCSTVTDVGTDLYEGSAGERLVELSAGAELVVIGSRGLGALARSVVGSVTTYVAAHARCPVIVVRGPGPIPMPASPGPVVLGLSPVTPDEALEFAFGEATLRRLRLVIVHAAHLPVMPWGTAMAPVLDAEALTRAGREEMEERSAPWRGRYPGVPVEVHAVTDTPKEALGVASAGASLVVVGADRNRHYGGHLGAVVRAMIEHASCPVAVVPVPADRPHRRAGSGAPSGGPG
ncbi:nucleotide-binding universal stress UspA family protein [Streptosporangium becharense]|uniref:Nucleotide-binding universal stress UspA family protein n=1 Tax=Streptosporangium becharense TaxID=1816182 RepID=A0A7W9IMX2_9ACTN|nr:universal stress protein [Streptosporangium becharense]MBB2910315.1 nucleotide-binding universal stress UspA family protein [Streptosporangium becharense]MBB5823058.1 nucleotide-binding universal stress UspA family protein [Streptosporangium becharense]